MLNPFKKLYLIWGKKLLQAVTKMAFSFGSLHGFYAALVLPLVTRKRDVFDKVTHILLALVLSHLYIVLYFVQVFVMQLTCNC